MDFLSNLWSGVKTVTGSIFGGSDSYANQIYNNNTTSSSSSTVNTSSGVPTSSSTSGLNASYQPSASFDYSKYYKVPTATGYDIKDVASGKTYTYAELEPYFKAGLNADFIPTRQTQPTTSTANRFTVEAGIPQSSGMLTDSAGGFANIAQSSFGGPGSSTGYMSPTAAGSGLPGYSSGSQPTSAPILPSQISSYDQYKALYGSNPTAESFFLTSYQPGARVPVFGGIGQSSTGGVSSVYDIGTSYDSSSGYTPAYSGYSGVSSGTRPSLYTPASGSEPWMKTQEVVDRNKKVAISKIKEIYPLLSDTAIEKILSADEATRQRYLGTQGPPPKTGIGNYVYETALETPVTKYPAIVGKYLFDSVVNNLQAAGMLSGGVTIPSIISLFVPKSSELSQRLEMVKADTWLRAGQLSLNPKDAATAAKEDPVAAVINAFNNTQGQPQISEDGSMSGKDVQDSLNNNITDTDSNLPTLDDDKNTAVKSIINQSDAKLRQNINTNLDAQTKAIKDAFNLYSQGNPIYTKTPNASGGFDVWKITDPFSKPTHVTEGDFINLGINIDNVPTAESLSSDLSSYIQANYNDLINPQTGLENKPEDWELPEDRYTEMQNRMKDLYDMIDKYDNITFNGPDYYNNLLANIEFPDPNNPGQTKTGFNTLNQMIATENDNISTIKNAFQELMTSAKNNPNFTKTLLSRKLKFYEDAQKDALVYSEARLKNLLEIRSQAIDQIKAQWDAKVKEVELTAQARRDIVNEVDKMMSRMAQMRDDDRNLINDVLATFGGLSWNEIPQAQREAIARTLNNQDYLAMLQTGLKTIKEQSKTAGISNITTHNNDGVLTMLGFDPETGQMVVLGSYDTGTGESGGGMTIGDAQLMWGSYIDDIAGVYYDNSKTAEQKYRDLVIILGDMLAEPWPKSYASRLDDIRLLTNITPEDAQAWATANLLSGANTNTGSTATTTEEPGIISRTVSGLYSWLTGS